MGILRDIFEEKVKIWEGTDTEVYEQFCTTLKQSGMKIQAFKVNQERPKCNGNCAGCAAMQQIPEGGESWEKIGSGLCDDLVEHGTGTDLFAIYVKKSEVEKAKQLLNL
jgi:N-acetylglutamate synthase-like GNAT family acetyltransferase